MTSIVIIEPDHLFRDGVRRILESSNGLHVVAEASDAREASRVVREHHPEIAVLAFGSLGSDTHALLATVRSKSPRTRCIALAAGHRPGMVQEALTEGAAAFLLRSSTPRQLLAAIDAVARGRPYLAPEVTGELVNTIAAGERPFSSRPLTTRQHQVLTLIVEGHSTKEIASELGISIGTAQTHRAKLMNRFGVHKASSLVRHAIRDGFVGV